MARKNKLKRFADLLTFPNVFENFNAKDPKLIGKDGVQINLKGQWREKYFKNDNPIILELACGKGEYSLGLAQKNPDKNYIGVDIKGARIWVGARKALAEELYNVAFLRTRIEQIYHFFDKNEVDEIWITFPDPFLRKSKANRRLTAANFINIYRRFLKEKGIVHLKTDEPNLYNFTLETITETPGCRVLYHDDDIYAKPLVDDDLEIKTYYEGCHLEAGKTIKYIKFLIDD